MRAFPCDSYYLTLYLIAGLPAFVAGRNNQSHLGLVLSSNLCTEIVQHSTPEHPAVCTLASVALPEYVLLDSKDVDHSELHRVTKIIVNNLDKLFEQADYPVASAFRPAIDNRSLGIGVQGLAETFAMLELPFSSDRAKRLNIEIFETIYHAALEASTELAKHLGSHVTFAASPASHGRLQLDMWDVRPSGRYDFAALRDHITRYGLRHAMLTAQMPTASSSQILGHSEGIDPFVRRVPIYYGVRGSRPDLHLAQQHRSVSPSQWHLQ